MFRNYYLEKMPYVKKYFLIKKKVLSVMDLPLPALLRDTSPNCGNSELEVGRARRGA